MTTLQEYIDRYIQRKKATGEFKSIWHFKSRAITTDKTENTTGHIETLNAAEVTDLDLLVSNPSTLELEPGKYKGVKLTFDATKPRCRNSQWHYVYVVLVDEEGKPITA